MNRCSSPTRSSPSSGSSPTTSRVTRKKPRPGGRNEISRWSHIGPRGYFAPSSSGSALESADCAASTAVSSRRSSALADPSSPDSADRLQLGRDRLGARRAELRARPLQRVRRPRHRLRVAVAQRVGDLLEPAARVLAEQPGERLHELRVAPARRLRLQRVEHAQVDVRLILRRPPALDRVAQRLAGHRLGQVVVHAGVEARLAHGVHGVRGHRQDRHAPAVLARADRTGRLVAVHDRHVAVHEDDREGLGGRGRDGLLAVLGDLDAVAALAQHLGGHHAVDGVVVDDQHRDLGRRRRGLRLGLGRLGHHLEVDGEPERAAAPRLAGRADRAAHQLDQLAADAQPEPGAAVLARGRGVGLGERLEQPLGLLGVDADPGVGDLEAHAAPARARLALGDAHGDLALRGELDRVADQVGEHLLEAEAVAHHVQPRLALDERAQVEALPARGLGEQLDRVVDRVGEAELGVLELEPPASILDRSRMSLMIVSSCSPEVWTIVM